MVAIVDSMKLMGQESNDKASVALSSELKEIAQELADRHGYKNLSHWIKAAMIEKAERDFERQ